MHGKRFPSDHPYRRQLNDEVHARPPEELVAPMRLSFLALSVDTAQRESNFALMCDLARERGAPMPEDGSNHYSEDMGSFRLKWEQHTEFMRFKFIVGEEEEARHLPNRRCKRCPRTGWAHFRDRSSSRRM